MELNIELINAIIKVVILLVATILTKYAIPYVKTKISAEKVALIVSYASVLVRGIEQKVKESGQGQKKLEEVTRLLAQRANEIGLVLSSEDIRLIIENAVKEMKEVDIKM